jgi:hypothetical protein
MMPIIPLGAVEFCPGDVALILAVLTLGPDGELSWGSMTTGKQGER